MWARDWLSEIARIGRGGHPETTVTEEYDAAGNLKTRTTRPSGLAAGSCSMRLKSRHTSKRPRARAHRQTLKIGR